MNLLEQAQDFLLALRRTGDPVFGRLSKKIDPLANESELQVLCNVINSLYEKKQELEAKFEKPMARTKSREIDVTHPDILASQVILKEIREFLEDDSFGSEHDELLVNAAARFSAAKKGLRAEQRKAVYL